VLVEKALYGENKAHEEAFIDLLHMYSRQEGKETVHALLETLLPLFFAHLARDPIRDSQRLQVRYGHAIHFFLHYSLSLDSAHADTSSSNNENMGKRKKNKKKGKANMQQILGSEHPKKNLTSLKLPFFYRSVFSQIKSIASNPSLASIAPYVMQMIVSKAIRMVQDEVQIPTYDNSVETFSYLEAAIECTTILSNLIFMVLPFLRQASASSASTIDQLFELLLNVARSFDTKICARLARESNEAQDMAYLELTDRLISEFLPSGDGKNKKKKASNVRALLGEENVTLVFDYTLNTLLHHASVLFREVRRGMSSPLQSSAVSPAFLFLRLLSTINSNTINYLVTNTMNKPATFPSNHPESQDGHIKLEGLGYALRLESVSSLLRSFGSHASDALGHASVGSMPKILLINGTSSIYRHMNQHLASSEGGDGQMREESSHLDNTLPLAFCEQFLHEHTHLPDLALGDDDNFRPMTL
jgi:hypothetical protein